MVVDEAARIIVISIGLGIFQRRYCRQTLVAKCPSRLPVSYKLQPEKIGFVGRRARERMCARIPRDVIYHELDHNHSFQAKFDIQNEGPERLF
jgi:hypothetical protein